MIKGPEWNCRVCGYEFDDEPPWGDGRTPSFDNCPCCGVEIGIHDELPRVARIFRQRWVERGAPWAIASVVPDGLSTEQRLTHVPPDFQ